MLQKLRQITNKLLLNEKLSQEKKHQLELIKHILEDDQCFFKLDITTAYNILLDLGFNKEESILIYKELISSKNY